MTFWREIESHCSQPGIVVLVRGYGEGKGGGVFAAGRIVFHWRN